MSIKKSYGKNSAEYTVTYSDMRGVDFSQDTENAKRYRFTELENMYKDYSNGGAGVVESIPGFRRLYRFNKKIHAIYTHKDKSGEEYVVVHAKSNLYRFKMSERDSLAGLKKIGTLADTKSRAFISGCDLYILDGSKITRVSGDGVCSDVGDESDSAPYVPTTYFCGEEYEQRNLLTDRFREKYRITSASELSFGTEGLKYRILSENEKTCSVTGLEAGIAGVVSIPGYVDISGVRYKVAEIADRAFYQNYNITSVYLPSTVLRIGVSAFEQCLNLKEAITESGTKIIDHGAFFACKELATLYLGADIERIEAAAFSSCPLLTHINYAASPDRFSVILMNYAHIIDHVINYGTPYTKISVEIPIFSPATEIYSVSVDSALTEYGTKTKNSLIYAVVITKEDKSELDGKEIEVYGKMDSAKFTKNSVGTNFISEEGGYINGRDAIFGCTVAESFDGRIFLSGNKALPNTVFFSSRDLSGRNNPLYFGILNYFNDGIGSFTVESMLAAGDSLAVFKSGDDGGGSIYYHIPKETGIEIMPKVYPVSYIHTGISAIGPSISFFDDPIFISSLGITALNKKAINLERSIAVRSHNINTKLLSENLYDIEMAKWCGYLAVMAGEHIYLADSRQTFTHPTGNVEYEWYMLTGIGTYLYDDKIFRFSPHAPDGYYVHDNVDEICTETVYLTSDEEDNAIFYAEIDGKKYAVYTNDEYFGGVFNPACCIHAADGDLLLFGTEGGDICIFNNDMRGEPPLYIKNCESFDIEDYRENHKSELNPYYYTFSLHPARYVLRCADDNGGFPNLTKNTVKHSMTVKYKSLGRGDIICEVGTDNGKFKEVGIINDTFLDFGELDFSRFSFENLSEITVALPEKEKSWIEKSLALSSEGFGAPFGICSITYRFKIKGRIKNQKG